MRLGLGRRFLRRRPELGSAAKCRHEIVRLIGVLALAPVHVGERCADLPETKIRTRIRHTFEPGKRYPFGHLLTAQASEELAKATARTKSFLAIDALTNYVQSESWQIRDIHEGIKEADAGEFATDKQVKAVFAKYGA